jgi:hypothetical protein
MTHPFEMRIYIAFLLVFITNLTFGQNNHFSLGYKDNGICFGNSKNNNGIRFNFIDKGTNEFNGLNITGSSNSVRTNGIGIGVVKFNDSICNGLSLGLINLTRYKLNGIAIGLSAGGYKTNGLALGGLGVGAKKFNGIGIAGLSVIGDTLNGLFLSAFGISDWNTEQICLINGLTFGTIIGANTKKMNGLSLSVFTNVIDTLNGVSVSLMNRTKELHGVQLGLWNVAENNKIFKKMPILNFNFRKKARR